MSELIEFKDVNDLYLDPSNPRLPESVERDQSSMIDYIARSTSIEELMEAIGANGFFPGEPLIVVPNEDGGFCVVEGNRRLTAVKLLNNHNLLKKSGERLRSIVENAKEVPSKLPVVVRKTRAEVLPYLGFRHITGVKAWEPLAKARYIEQLFALTKAEENPRDRYQAIAREIGSRRDYIRRSLDALAVYKAIEENDFYEIEDLTEQSLKFAVLSTSLADERIGKFVGILRENSDGDIVSTDPIIDPSNLRKDEVRELTQWLFRKDEKGKTRVGESRNLRLLSAVVDNQKALSAFRHGASLKIAYQLTSDMTSDFVDLLYQAETTVAEAASMVATVEFKQDALDVARRIREHITLIGNALRSKEVKNDEF